MSDLPICSIVIPAFNEEQHITACLTSIENQSYSRGLYEIILVDNGSTDRTAEIASAFADQVVNKSDGNIGAVRNFGIERATGEIIICTDADCVVPPNWVETGVDLLRSQPKHAFGGGLMPRKNAKWIEKYWILNETGNRIQQRALAGSSIFMWKRDFERIGGFDETVTSGEDSGLYEQALAHGLAVIISPALSVAHLGGPETPRDFVRRQIWHSENYIPDLANSLKDKVFWLTLTFLGCLAGTLFSILTASYFSAAILLLCSQMPAATLSLKRIIRSAWRVNSIHELTKILIIDNFYLVGRCIGLLKGFWAVLVKPTGRAS
ncbi:glycosyltransferase [Marinobacter sp.]|uniref:glycosyltransferase n=1 Tax=Marinobacter sp. TaxID=50741 RepID=UPI003A928F34